MQPVTRVRIIQQRTALIDAVRACSRAQKDLWQKVPWLALQADGRTGYSDSYSRAYNNGLWTLTVAHHGYCSAFVDCATGELVDAELRPLVEKYVLEVAAYIEQIDAHAVTKGLAADASRRTSDCYNADDQALWRKETAQSLNLSEGYVRLKKPQWSEEFN
ncbi:MAG: hypothetical protein AAB421_05245 [Patescibacteria group bacterium]